MAPTSHMQENGAVSEYRAIAESAPSTPTGVREVTNAWGVPWRPSTWRRPAWAHPRVFRTEVLSGLMVALVLIPEAIAFALVAGVDPRVGLFTSVVMAISISFLGGRPAMVTAATAAIALVAAPLVREHGVDYLVAAVILAGLIQVVFAVLGFARLMRFVPRSVMVGFVNALAILIFSSQLPHLWKAAPAVYILTAVGVGLILITGRLTTVIPAPLVPAVLLTAVVMIFSIDVPTVGDEGALPQGLPSLYWPQVPHTMDTLRIVAPFALAIAIVGLLQSLMTAKLVDDVTDTHSDKTREAWGQGATNIIAGLFGGMGGTAMIGQTMMNVKVAKARTRLSTFLAGVFLLVLMLMLGDVVAAIPMAALVAILVYVAWNTFDWHSLAWRTLKRMPKSETAIMLVTMAVVVATNNLAIGVVVGVTFAMVAFARQVARLVTVKPLDVADDHRTYLVSGSLFFASSNDLYFQFDYGGDPDHITIDLTQAHIWDASSVAALDSIVTKYERRAKHVTIVGLNEISARFHGRLAGQLES